MEKGVRERSQNPPRAGLRSERLGDPGAQPTSRAEAPPGQMHRALPGGCRGRLAEAQGFPRSCHPGPPTSRRADGIRRSSEGSKPTQVLRGGPRAKGPRTFVTLSVLQSAAFTDTLFSSAFHEDLQIPEREASPCRM